MLKGELDGVDSEREGSSLDGFIVDGSESEVSLVPMTALRKKAKRTILVMPPEEDSSSDVDLDDVLIRSPA